MTQIIKKVPTGSTVNWSASRTKYQRQTGTLIMPNNEKTLSITLIPEEYDLVWEGGGEVTIYYYPDGVSRPVSKTYTSPVLLPDTVADSIIGIYFGDTEGLTKVTYIGSRMYLKGIYYVSTKEGQFSFVGNSTLEAFNDFYYETANSTVMRMFQDCTKLSTFKGNHFNYTKGEAFQTYYMFDGCTGLYEFSGNRTNNSDCWVFDECLSTVTDAGMFYGCSNLHVLADVDFEKISGINLYEENRQKRMFYNCTSLSDVHNIKNINGYPVLRSSTNRKYPVRFFQYSPLTTESCRNIFNALNDLSEYTYEKGYAFNYIYLKSSVISQLPESVKEIATNKGWLLAAA